MSKFALLVASAALISFDVADANASTTFDWSYTDGGSNVGMGTLSATYDFADQYTVDSISGTANGQAIVGLSGYDGPDQRVFSPSPPDVALDSLGIAFSVAGGKSFNIYEDDGLYTLGPPYGCGGVYCLLGPGTVGAGDPFVTVAFSLTPVSATPLPGPVQLFAIGLGVMAWFGWRSRGKAAALQVA
jgi:hypothetical protein